MLDLMELLNMMTLPSKYSVVETFTMENITNGKYALPDCLKSLADCSKMGLQSVGQTLLTHLRRNFVDICEVTEVGELSYEMLTRLLMSMKSNQTILRIKTLVFWLAANNVELVGEEKDEALKTLNLNLEHFTHRELASSEVRKSGLYDVEEIMERMEKLNDESEAKFKQLTNDMKMVKLYTARGLWNDVFPSDLTKRYEDF